ncbi:MAG: hypothetical protein WCT04_01755 [Planctomycetota bacterium]
MLHSVLTSAEKTLGCVLRVDGDIGLLERPRRALLVSRGERNPAPDEARLCAVIDAARSVVSSGEALVVGTEREHWDVALWTCREAGGAAIVVLHERSEAAEFFPENVLLVWPAMSEPALSKEERLLLRDQLVGMLASCATAIQIRANGNMARVAADMSARGCGVEAWAIKKSERTTRKLDSGLELGSATPSPREPNGRLVGPLPEGRGEGRRLASLVGSEFEKMGDAYLTHFTREPDGCWPGESRGDYVRWLASGIRFDQRDGFQALRRILSQRRIVSCGRLINGGTPVVCLTARDPGELLVENRWRKGLGRWTYSRYALSIRRDVLEAAGARVVRYVSADVMQLAPISERHFLQIEASSGIDWRNEAEWRVTGDLDFSRLDSGATVAWVSSETEAASIESEFGIRAFLL